MHRYEPWQSSSSKAKSVPVDVLWHGWVEVVFADERVARRYAIDSLAASRVERTWESNLSRVYGFGMNPRRPRASMAPSLVCSAKPLLSTTCTSLLSAFSSSKTASPSSTG